MNELSNLELSYLRAAQRAIKEPQWFYENVLGMAALPWQIKATHAVFDVRRKIYGIPTVINHEGLPRITIRSCHGPGKTQFLAFLMHIWNFTTYGTIACTAPKEAQLTRRLLPRYRKLLKSAPADYSKRIKVLGTRVVVNGDDLWGSYMETASDPDNLAGYHDEPQLFLIDEASAKRLDPMFPVIEGALTTPGSVSVEIGNPTRVEGEFWAHHCKPKVRDLYFKFHIKAEDAPELVSQAWIDNMILKYGEDSPITKIRALGEFASYDEYLLIPPEYVDDALDCEEYDDGSHPKLRVSVDVADGGADSSVITVAKHYESYKIILKQKSYYFNPAESPIKVAKAAIDLFDAYGGDNDNGDDFVVDSLGVGSGTAGVLITKGYRVVVYKGGEKSDNVSRWRNRRVQSYMALYEDFRDGVLKIAVDAIDDEEEFRQHLSLIKRAIGNDRVDDLEPKQKIKAEGNPSPDRADSLAEQYATQIPVYSKSSSISALVVGELETANNDAQLI